MIYIYVIASSPEGPCKIGYSNDPFKRLKKLQTGHPERLSVHHCIPFAPAHAPLVERKIHETVRHLRMSGEWFRLTVEDAIAEVNFALIRYGEDGSSD